MKKVFVLSLLVFFNFSSFANLEYIDLQKISNESKCINAFNSLKVGLPYYEQWSTEWKHDKPKKEVINTLQEHYKTFSAISTKNEDLYLLLGEIAHFLYNLEDSASHRLAVVNYNLAIEQHPKSFRGYWFLGYHFAQSANINLAIDNLLKAKELLPDEHQPVDFWEEFGVSMVFANMPSHAIFAMDRVKAIRGEIGYFETLLGESVRKKIIAMDNDKIYLNKEIWEASGDSVMSFTSRPMGVKILVDSKWGLTVTDYKNHGCAFIMSPPEILNKKGKKIGYSIAIIMKVVKENDKLEDFVKNMLGKDKQSKVSKISFSDKYDNLIAYEDQNPKVYKNLGGAHIYGIGIERNAPEYPGLLLERPSMIPNGKEGTITYYSSAKSKDRFKGKIFYFFMLDTCEDIHEESLAIFKNLFEKLTVIE
ncbi:hypothetical protein VB264_15575 [Arcicella aquatica]|uniref:Tetratricopeptide repeat protein n=1 Tax=Arcicella aquatica TaxID=217141 RepID=A0ABU5QQ68_9BACT|nr:hypothetical protein [Arcicella aquatica]MEA5259216.1 hypothetical protein [Arcicella aquatica]